MRFLILTGCLTGLLALLASCNTLQRYVSSQYTPGPPPYQQASLDSDTVLLFSAIETRKPNSVATAIANGADVNAQRPDDGLTPLCLAAQQKDDAAGQQVMADLVAAGADVNATELSYGLAPLHFAAQNGYLEHVQFLLDHGADLDAGSNEQMTPLMVAAQSHQRAVVFVLLDAGAGLHARDSAGNSLLHYGAIYNNSYLAAAAVAAGVDLNAPAGSNQLAPLHLAVNYGNIDVCQLLVDAGCDVDCPDPEGNTALTYAAAYNRSAAVECLLAAGADVHRANNVGVAPFHHAVSANPRILRAVLAAATDLDQADQDGLTALVFAAKYCPVTTVQALLDAGADPAVADQDGKTALDWAKEKQRSEIVALLEE